MSKSLFGFTIVLMLSVLRLSAQTESKDVTITSSGSGATIEDAKQSALRSATEQAFGAFISSKTEMFNDQVVADQMASVSSGNIKSFEILNQDQLPDGRWGVTLKAVVSVDKLTSFVQAKGIAIEVKGGMFALNIKQQLLNEQGEIHAVAEMVGLLHEPMQMSFDYNIKSSDPKSLDSESNNWEIPLEVTAICNKNMEFCNKYLVKTISAISLSSEEVETYTNLNKEVFPLIIKSAESLDTFYLRKKTSATLIKSFINNWGFYVKNYHIDSGTKYFHEINNKSTIHKYARIEEIELIDGKRFNATIITCLNKGMEAGNFILKDNLSLSQIENITGYKVNSKGVISNFKNGGFTIQNEDGKSIIIALLDIDAANWSDVIKFYDTFSINGYSDWRLPNKEELNIFSRSFIYNNLIGQNKYLDNYWCLGCSIKNNPKSIIRPFRSTPPLENSEAHEIPSNSQYRIKYPAMARENGIQGKVTISFVVGADGIAKNFKIIENVGGGCAEEVISFIKYKNWYPKIVDGRPVESQTMEQSYNFKLN